MSTQKETLEAVDIEIASILVAIPKLRVVLLHRYWSYFWNLDRTSIAVLNSRSSYFSPE